MIGWLAGIGLECGGYCSSIDDRVGRSVGLTRRVVQPAGGVLDVQR